MAGTSESSAPVRVGDVVAGKYRVERVLGQGGMGIVVAARHRDLGHLVAIKFLLDTVSGKRDIVERFLLEARAAVQLKSEHTTRVLDVGVHEGSPADTAGTRTLPFMVMEHLEGTSLARLARMGNLPAHAAALYVAQACEALSEAHQLGIVHRDLKPDNLFLTQRPTGAPLVKVLDFGISRVPGANDELGRLTGTADVMGTPHYMSPEQMHATRNAEPRSDVWALGVSLFELLTGRVPFPGATVTEICTKVLTADPPRTTDIRADIPLGLDAVVSKCLQKRPEHRFQSTLELRTALLPFCSAESPAAPVTEGPRAVAPPTPSPGDISDAATTLFRPNRGAPKGDTEPSAVQPAETGTAWNAETLVHQSQRRRRLAVAILSSLLAVAAVLATALGIWGAPSRPVREIADSPLSSATAPTSPVAALPPPAGSPAVPGPPSTGSPLPALPSTAPHSTAARSAYPAPSMRPKQPPKSVFDSPRK